MPSGSTPSIVMSSAILPAARAQNFLVALANGKPIGHLHLDVQPRDLIEPDSQGHFRKVMVLDVHGRAKDGHIACLEFRQEFCRQHIRAAAFFV